MMAADSRGARGSKCVPSADRRDYARCRTNRLGVSTFWPAYRRLSKVSLAYGVIDTENDFANVRVANVSNIGRMFSARTLLGVTSSISVLTTIAEEEVQTVASWVQELDLTHLSGYQRRQVLEMLGKYSVLLDGTDLGPMTEPHLDIATGDARPVHQELYRARPHERHVIDEEIESMWKLKVIRPSHSPRSSPVVLVLKNDISTRLYIDYQRLNTLSVRD